MIYFYRIEDDNFRGPYNNARKLFVKDLLREPSHVYQPSPLHDFTRTYKKYFKLQRKLKQTYFYTFAYRDFYKFHQSSDVKYGFMSIKSLKLWFNKKDLKILQKHGFHVKVYEIESLDCETCYILGTQAIIKSECLTNYTLLSIEDVL